MHLEGPETGELENMGPHVVKPSVAFGFEDAEEEEAAKTGEESRMYRHRRSAPATGRRTKMDSKHTEPTRPSRTPKR